MISTWPYDKPIARRVINVSSIFIRTRVSLKKEHRLINRYTSSLAKAPIRLLSSIPWRNTSYFSYFRPETSIGEQELSFLRSINLDQSEYLKQTRFIALTKMAAFTETVCKVFKIETLREHSDKGHPGNL
jgi:hypothetical protein